VALDVAACRQSLGVRTVVDNLSAEGFYLRLAYPVKEGESLLVIAQFWQAVLLLRGQVARVEELEDGTFGIAFSITRHQIFSSLVGDAKLEKDIPLDRGLSY
jgi:hypothetical protein